jgi:hypothetical protein
VGRKSGWGCEEEVEENEMVVVKLMPSGIETELRDGYFWPFFNQWNRAVEITGWERL